jgi:macrolide transport system ATP-binding/permease protein
MGEGDRDSRAICLSERGAAMRKLRGWLLRLWGLFSRNHSDKEFAEEIETHLQMQIEDNLRSGMDPEQARREAILKSGGIEGTMQAYRERTTLPFVETLGQDLRYTLRQLRKNPGFAATAILVLTLGIGATVSIFSFADAALIKPLPYREPSRLVVIFGSIPLGPRFHLSFPDYYDLKKLNKVFTSFDVYDSNGFMLSTPTGTQLAPGGRVSAGFFRTLGVAPVLGRDFSPGEDTPSAPRTVILSYAAWQNRYAKRADVLGQTVTLDGNLNTIIGVLPRDFHFSPAAPVDFWTAEHDESPCRGCHWLFGIARLKDGMSIQTAAADMTSIARQLEAQYPDSNRSQGASVVALPDVIVGDIRPILSVLLGGAGLLLVIAGVNVASLLLVRTQGRKREIAVRGALGATRKRLLRQFVTEGLVLAASASVLGLAAADGAMHLLTRLIPADTLAAMPYLQGLGLSPHVLAFTLLISLFSALLFSLTPIVSMSREEMRAGLTEGSRAASGTVWHRFGANLVVIELATAVVLLVGAGLLGKSFYRLLQVDPGLQPGNLATLPLATPRANYSKDPQVIALEHQILDHVSALPGVSSAAITNKLPVGDGDFTTSFRVVGRPYHGEHNEVAYRLVSTDYFKTLQSRLLEGRYFNVAEDATKPHVIIINRAMARQYFPGEHPVGMFINYDVAPPDQAMQVIGMIDDIREGPLDTSARSAMYVPFDQHPNGSFSVVARTSVDAQSLLPALTSTIHRIDPGIAVFGAATMEQRIHDSPPAYLHRASTWLVGSFAALALMLSVVGLYGVIAYSVSQRTREIGVRMALGAQRSMVYKLILKQAARLIAVGIVAGLAGSVAAATLMRNLLFGTEAWDAFTLTAVAVVLGSSAFLASYVPARRAASVNPLEALHAE